MREKIFKKGSTIRIKLTALVNKTNKNHIAYNRVEGYQVQIKDGWKILEFRVPKSGVWKKVEREVSL